MRYFSNGGDLVVGAWVNVPNNENVEYTVYQDEVEFTFAGDHKFDIQMGERALAACVAEFTKALEELRAKRNQPGDEDDEEF